MNSIILAAGAIETKPALFTVTATPTGYAHKLEFSTLFGSEYQHETETKLHEILAAQ